MYDYVFEWLRTATKEERHCNEMESFAKKHPILFMKFHTKSKDIVHKDIDSKEYLKAKEDLIEVFNKNKEDFSKLLEAIQGMQKK